MDENETTQEQKPTGQALNILNFKTASAEKLSQEVEYSDGMTFTVNFLSRSRLQHMYKSSQVMRIDKLTHTRVPQPDTDKFVKLFSEEVISGWKGVTPKSVATLIPLDKSNFSDAEWEQEIPYTQEQMQFLIKNAYDLDNFLQNYVQNLSNFEPDKEHEMGN